MKIQPTSEMTRHIPRMTSVINGLFYILIYSTMLFLRNAIAQCQYYNYTQRVIMGLFYENIT